MSRPGKQPRAPGELESAVLEYLWTGAEANARAVYEAVGRPRGLAYTTVLTVLQRLTGKGLVRRWEAGRAHVYSAAVSREQLASRRGEKLAAALSQLGSSGVAAFLSEAERIDPALVAELRRQLEGAR